MIIAGALGLAAPAAADPSENPNPEAKHPWCRGDYADDISALAPKAHEIERHLGGSFSYCVRTTAVYECLSYASDGSVERRRQSVTAHGTAFGLDTRTPGETTLVTNYHVVEYPQVTSERFAVGEVPYGCKRVAMTSKIVDNDRDEYAKDDLLLTRVGVDPSLDLAVVKVKGALKVMPWKIGKSQSLRPQNVVVVTGFPLGVLQATATGRVVSALDHDEDKDWDHDDFVVDALLSVGNSGSPVLAVSCVTGEYELVGIYHAGYTNTPALNVVVAIDQARDFLTTFRRTPRSRNALGGPYDAAARQDVDNRLKTAPDSFFPFGDRAASVHARKDRALIFSVYAKSFPESDYPAIALEDLPTGVTDTFGQLGRVWVGSLAGLRQLAVERLDSEGKRIIERLIAALRSSAAVQLLRRTLLSDDSPNKDQRKQIARLEKKQQKAVESQRAAIAPLADFVEKFAPPDELPARALAVVLADAATGTAQQ